MARVLYIKKYTQTLSQMLQSFRVQYPEYENSKVTYAGRLDPMAEGVMLLLTDHDVHSKNLYLQKNKTYRVDFCFGVSTDSYDILGVITEKKKLSCAQGIVNLDFLLGEYDQQYPIFSSKPVNGRPLWQWAKQGLLDQVIIPTKKIQVFSAKNIHTKNISSADMRDRIINAINQVEGDFRQNEIIDSWNNYFKEVDPESLLHIHRCEFQVSSGTYVRDLVQRISREVGVPAVCLKIERTHIHDLEGVKVLTK